MEQAVPELFNYPGELLTVGRPIADLFRHNAVKGIAGEFQTKNKLNRPYKKTRPSEQGNAYRRESVHRAVSHSRSS